MLAIALQQKLVVREEIIRFPRCRIAATYSAKARLRVRVLAVVTDGPLRTTQLAHGRASFAGKCKLTRTNGHPLSGKNQPPKQPRNPNFDQWLGASLAWENYLVGARQVEPQTRFPAGQQYQRSVRGDSAEFAERSLMTVASWLTSKPI
jgi:hypothetical protein